MTGTRSLALALLAAAPALCQSFGYGFRAGVRLTEAFGGPRSWQSSHGSRFYTPRTKPYTIGPLLAVRLPRGFGAETGFLYKRINYFWRFGQRPDLTAVETRANSWEVPMLANWGPRFGFARPYLGGGIALRRLSGATETTTLSFDLGPIPRPVTTTGPPADLRNTFTWGLVAGAGAELGRGRIRVLPELRYKHWNADQFRDVSIGVFYSSRDDIELLLGVAF